MKQLWARGKGNDFLFVKGIKQSALNWFGENNYTIKSNGFALKI